MTQLDLHYTHILAIHGYMYMKVFNSLSLRMLVPNSWDQQGRLASKETVNGLENNLTISFPSNISHKSLSTELLAP